MDFLIFIAVIWWLVSATKKAKEQQAKSRQMRKPTPDKYAEPAHYNYEHEKPVHKPAPKPAETEERPVVQAAPRAEMAPRVHTTVQVSEHDHTGMFEGSMAAVTGEGLDPHDHGQRPAQAMPSTYSDRIINSRSAEEDQPETAQPALDLGWDDSQSLVKAFVMQEVLTRPCDRKR